MMACVENLASAIGATQRILIIVWLCDDWNSIAIAWLLQIIKRKQIESEIEDKRWNTNTYANSLVYVCLIVFMVI